MREYAFPWSSLKAILEIPRSVKLLSRFYFYCCESLEGVTSESDSELERIEGKAFLNWDSLKFMIFRVVRARPR